ncbi:uncharacterized protein LOC125228792 [Leguminivora glycinivorella]|uniref:uncharacterized protein LOC125228792 n=1 Tax=Leguminivora glycinivorella TaxID=1035111 RepID=UPI00200F1D37|nr:uncharacterized protein LOC125228792 [Leguminivora glycinivorella]
MSETSRNESNSPDSQMPAQEDDVKFPPFPEPKDVDFDEDIPEEERKFYTNKFQDLNTVTNHRMHCTSCDRHLGCSASNEGRMRMHPMLRTLVCNTCFAFYNSGEFEKGDDGSELYCRWCGQGGQVYCCSDCPHVFCAKCIKRNLGTSKIKEIENTDDWKCFKCSNRPLWDLRASCWALLRYCDLKNRITMATQDPILKDKYNTSCTRDLSECCKNKKRREKLDSKKKEEKNKAENNAKTTAAVISKIPPTIQVKKFASINADEKTEKKAAKRSLSPKPKSVFLKNPIAVAGAKPYTSYSPMSKKIRMSTPNILSPVRFPGDRKVLNNTSIRIRANRPTVMPVMNPFNGYNSVPSFNNFINDNINLSLENLTQGLDMAAAAAAAMNNGQEDDVVCTPDFPLEPLCEVTEDPGDDDVQCMTPIHNAAASASKPPPLVPRAGLQLPDLSADNIIQMTEHDVTVNAQTGGLKFRVDPQTLSSNKMYRLPDGRIFAINANPNMPGGYSATIVAVTEAAAKSAPKGAIYSAKLSAVPPKPAPAPVRQPASVPVRGATARSYNARRNTVATRVNRGTETVTRECDLEVPVEWYRYNLVDAVDALEYSLSRLNRLKRDATTVHLRSRTVGEMRGLHRTLERLLHTSRTRFDEIRDNLNRGLKQYLARKAGGAGAGAALSDDDDDDVEILPDPNDNDDPIFIDENSVDSNANDTSSVDRQEVDLTGAMSNSELNDSGDKSIEMLDENYLKANEEMDERSSEKNDPPSKPDDVDPLECAAVDQTEDNVSGEKEEGSPKVPKDATSPDDAEGDKPHENNNMSIDEDKKTENDNKKDDETDHDKLEEDKDTSDGNNEIKISNVKSESAPEETTENKPVNGSKDTTEEDTEKKDESNEIKSPATKSEDKKQDTDDIRNENQDNGDKIQDAEMSEEMIQTLLEGDDGDNDDDTQTMNSQEIIGM